MTELVDKKNWSKKTLSAYNGGAKGTNCGYMAEGLPMYIEAPCENVTQGHNNTYIVLGRDRPGAANTGYGGRGASHCGMISLVAGRLGQDASDLDAEPPEGNPIRVEPNHRKDAAFIYISQKTDVDENLKLADGKIGKMTSKSAIALKADNLRFVARQGVKIVTGTDEKLSTGKTSLATYGIDLIAGNNSDGQQPIVKGDNLAECLQRFKDEVNKLNGILTGFVKYQLDFNIATMGHYHITTVPTMANTPAAATPGSPLTKSGLKTISNVVTRTLRSLSNQKYNLVQLSKQYLEKGDAKDGQTSYINSKYNTVN